ALLGVGLFATITNQFDRELDESLTMATKELARVVAARDRAAPSAAVRIDSTFDLRIPDRTLLVVDTLGRALDGAPVPARVAELSRAAVDSGSATGVFAEGERLLRAHAERVSLSGGRTVAAVGIADEVEIEDRYASLIATFGVAAIAAVMLVALG